jgi:hypothetical protein
MELTRSFARLLQNFTAVFTAHTYVTRLIAPHSVPTITSDNRRYVRKRMLYYKCNGCESLVLSPCYAICCWSSGR